jgi:hypothetical protein
MKLKLTDIIPGKQYYLTLLDNLNSQEILELKNFYGNKVWHHHIDILVDLYNSTSTINNINFFSLWREVSFYQAWLNEIARTITKDTDDASGSNMYGIFHLWKRMYSARKDFLEKLTDNAKAILKFKVDDNFNLWNIIIQSHNKSLIVDHIKAWNFSSIHLTNIYNTYSDHAGLNYFSTEEYLSSNLNIWFRQHLQS